MTLALDIITPLANSTIVVLSSEQTDALRDLHPSDVAETLEESGLTPSQMVEILVQVGNHKASDAFAQLEIETQQACLEASNAQTMLRFIENMEPDDPRGFAQDGGRGCPRSHHAADRPG